ncbi:MAG: GTPase ObgE [Candidatus Omnitrophota bacterium]|nr:GTPase ObgE [Candidatus Omnitrophota bacterium]
MFVDQAKIYLKAGNGGKGCHSIFYDRYHNNGQPDGGAGGKGADVVFTADDNIQTLLDFQYRQHFEADSGTHGSSNHKKGRQGKDLVIKVPPGTLIKNAATGLVLRELIGGGDSVVIARGGFGGHGNSKNHPATFGVPGEEKKVVLELKLIADVGIVGYPNAGKSTLISKISSAKPKIANYPFTTKVPVLGVVKIHGDEHMVFAEVPGLIEGAHLGKGLGDRFLRHVERTKTLIHLIDVSGFEGRDPYKDYISLNKELRLYSKELMKKPQVIALNKCDIEGARENVKKFKRHLRAKKVFVLSAATGEGIKELLVAVYKNVKSMKKNVKK